MIGRGFEPRRYGVVSIAYCFLRRIPVAYATRKIRNISNKSPAILER